MVLALVIALVLVALLLGGLGLFVKGLLWLFVIAAILLAVGAAVGYRGRAGV